MINSSLINNAEFHNKYYRQKDLELINTAYMNQSHSNVVLEIDKNGIYNADALITSKKNLKLGVQTADCMPVIVSDESKIGIIHIGWKGLENKIFFKTIQHFDLTRLKVSVGPHAQKCCYEIQNDLVLKFPDFSISKGDKNYLALNKIIENFCIKNFVEYESSSKCTIENRSFNSYRRDKTSSRQWSFVWI